MAFTPVNPTDPLDQPSHSGLHNQHSTDIEQHSTDIEALQEFYASLAGGEAGEVLAKTTGDDYDYDWLPGGTGGGPGGDYPGISTEDPNGLGLGTDGGLRVEPSDLLSDNAGQQLTVAPDDGKLYFGGLPAPGGKILQVVRASVNLPTTTNSTSEIDVPGMSVTITPQKNDSVILVVMSARVYADRESQGDKRVNIALRDSSNNFLLGGATHIVGGMNDGANLNFYPVTIIGYVEPSTTQAVTYKTRFSVADAETTGCFQNDAAQGQMYAIEVGA